MKWLAVYFQKSKNRSATVKQNCAQNEQFQRERFIENIGENRGKKHNDELPHGDGTENLIFIFYKLWDGDLGHTICFTAATLCSNQARHQTRFP